MITLEDKITEEKEDEEDHVHDHTIKDVLNFFLKNFKKFKSINL